MASQDPESTVAVYVGPEFKATDGDAMSAMSM